MIRFIQALVGTVTGKTQKRCSLPGGKNRWDMKTEFAGWESREKAGGSLRLTTKAAPSTLNIPRARLCASLGGWGRAEKVGSVLAPSEPIKKNLR